jgi:hypothetical protein
MDPARDELAALLSDPREEKAMRPRLRLAFLHTTLYMVLIASTTFAARNVPRHQPLPPGAGFAPLHSASPCQLGQAGPPVDIQPFVFPPDDQYFTLINPADCGCGGNSQVVAAHMVLNWPVNCSMDVDVSVVGAEVLSPGCLAPVATAVLCPPTRITIDGSGGPVKEHVFPLSNCCISGPAFLSITFVTQGTCISGAFPELATTNNPVACQSYNLYPGDPEIRDIVGFYGFQGNPVMWVEADCCTGGPVTPTVPLAGNSVIQAAPDGSFLYRWVYTVVGSPLTIASYSSTNLDNTTAGTYADAFCQSTVPPGVTIDLLVQGSLVDKTRSGRVQNYLASCGPLTVLGETTVLPAITTAARRATWGAIKLHYR